MPIQLKDPAHIPFEGLIVDKAVIKEMVTAYRKDHASDVKCLKFIHFNLMEVIQLFIDNGMLDPALKVSDQLSKLQYSGLKIYLGNHSKETTCPTNPDPTKPNPYLYMDTAILCNTQLDTLTRTWKDQLLPETITGDPKNSVSILGLGEGMDRGSICPPNCPSLTKPSPDPDGYFHEDVTTS